MTTAAATAVQRGCIDLSIPGVPLIPILYEDDHILVVNKPSPMLSVPGKSIISRLPRHIEWRNAINNAADNEQLKMTAECRDQLRALSIRTAKADNVPRKQQPFENCVKKMLKIIDDPSLVTELWEVVNKSDEMQHKVSLADIPPHRISAAEAAEFYCNSLSPLSPAVASQAIASKVFAVHRLDCETSGVLFLAKTEEAAGEMGIQFRGRMVSFNPIAPTTCSLVHNIRSSTHAYFTYMQVGKKYIAIVDGDISETFTTAQNHPDRMKWLQILPQESVISPTPLKRKRKTGEPGLLTCSLRGSVTAPIYGRYEDRPKQVA
jgi:hypothetical protein